MKRFDYKIAEGIHKENMESEVVKWERMGYDPQGGVAISKTDKTNVRKFSQAMVKRRSFWARLFNIRR